MAHFDNATIERWRDSAGGWIRDNLHGNEFVRNIGCVLNGEYVRFTDDVYFEETTVFAVDDNGHVDSTAIRAFLGY